jgi:flagellar basal-body rod protein FlgG
MSFRMLRESIMFCAFCAAASGMTAQQLSLNAIVHSHANSNTRGSQQPRVQFSDVFSLNEIKPDSAATEQTTVAAELQSGLGARPSAAEAIQTQGDFAATGNSLDLAIQGAGFFQILLPNGQTGYTRTGCFHPDAQGTMVTADGNALQPTVTIPSDAVSITIGSDGTVSVTQPGQTAATQVGEIQTALFVNPEGLNSVGNNTFTASIASGNPVVGTPGGAEGLGTVQQGVLEQPNVSISWTYMWR